MKGRGVRIIPDADLQQVTPDAEAQDPLRVSTRSASPKTTRATASRSSASPAVALRQAASSRWRWAGATTTRLSSLAGRLAALDQEINDEDRARIGEAAGGRDLHELANGLLDAIDPDRIEADPRCAARAHAGEEQRAVVEKELKDGLPPVRQRLCASRWWTLKQRSEIVDRRDHGRQRALRRLRPSSGAGDHRGTSSSSSTENKDGWPRCRSSSTARVSAPA